jgi:hypothetical protein
MYLTIVSLYHLCYYCTALLFIYHSTGFRNKIQISYTTANLLIAAEKGHWVTCREDAVEAKGKGVMETFWLDLEPKKRLSMTGGSKPLSHVEAQTQALGPAIDNVDASLLQKDVAKQKRLVDWTTELLYDHVRAIAAKRAALGHSQQETAPLVYHPKTGTTCLDEVAEVIRMPKFNDKAISRDDQRHIEMDPIILQQLHSCVDIIASAYRDNPFHNFEHACHVTMSTDKFLKRIVAPELDLNDDERENAMSVSAKLHAYTHGIHSDPITLFGIVFSALIHDVDHRGVSNVQLMKEDGRLAHLYQNKSVAEQNSLDIAWDILMCEEFNELRACLFATEDDLLRFRQVIVNVVLATDIFDKELNDLRKVRWAKAFDSNRKHSNDENDRRATIVIEHIIQASDVAHTMQHWHIYRKWNERLFMEMSQAYRAGRMAVDPASFWYQGELGFFDNYIIPLAKKLKDCNVFGVSSDECLNYANQNRMEWEQRGQEIVAELVHKSGQWTV